MNHILYKLIKQNYFSLRALLQYGENKDVPKNLKESYEKSAELAEEVSNGEESFLWFTNMKNPATYAGSEDVHRHCRRIHSTLLQKPKVIARRIHLFYAKHNQVGISGAIENSRSLFTNMLAEYLHGMESKVLWISNPDSIAYIVENDKRSGQKIGELYLLDYALHFSYSVNGPEGLVDGQWLPGKAHALCSDFTADTMVTENPTERESDIKAYQKNKVYVLDSPQVFSLMKLHFMSLWNLEKYAGFVEKAFGDDSLTKARGNVEMLDFWQFWKKSVFKTELLDPNIFEDIYLWSSAKNRGLDKDLVKTVVSKACKHYCKKTVFESLIEKVVLRPIVKKETFVW